MGELSGPFPGSWALATGSVSRWELSKDYARVFPDVYVRKDVALDPRTRAMAAAHWRKGDAVIAGLSASAMHGVRWVADDAPAELLVQSRIRPPKGVVCRQDRPGRGEICTIAGFSVTTAARTGFDLGRWLEFDDAVPALDALCNTTRTEPSEIADIADRHSGARNVSALRRTLGFVDCGAESPRETRLRLLLVDAGFPAPATQVRIRDASGMVVARADLGWREWRVLVEYDGKQHWTDRRQRAWDIDRSAILAALGWVVIRVSDDLLDNRPWVIVERVRQALRAAGAPVRSSSGR